jgi:hypothetical protein
MRFRHLPLLVLLAFALLAPTASASPAAAPTHATSASTKAKKCKRRFGESKKHWLKRCKCKAFKKGETRKKFKKRCPGAKVPKRKPAPPGGGSKPDPAPANPAPGAAPPASGPLTGQAAIDYVNAAVKGMRISRQSCSGTGCERSLTEFVDFCSDGASFNGRTTNDNAIGGVYESVYSGTFKVLEAQVNAERTGAQARVNLTVMQASGNDTPPQSGDRLMTLAGSNLVYMGETEYTRGTAQC